jgi:hypothetical protein
MSEKPVANEETRKKLKAAFQKLQGTPFVKTDAKQDDEQKTDFPKKK